MDQIEFHIKTIIWDDGSYEFIIVRVPYSKANLEAIEKLDHVTAISTIK